MKIKTLLSTLSDQKQSLYLGQYFLHTLLLDICSDTKPNAKTFDELVNSHQYATTFVHEYGHFVCMTSTLLGSYLRYLHSCEYDLKLDIYKCISESNGGRLPEEEFDKYVCSNVDTISSDLGEKILIYKIVSAYKYYLITGRIQDKVLFDACFDHDGEAEFGINAILENYSYIQENLYHCRHLKTSHELIQKKIERKIDTDNDEYSCIIKIACERYFLKVGLPALIELMDFAMMGCGELFKIVINIESIAEALFSGKKIQIPNVFRYMCDELLKFIEKENVWTKYITENTEINDVLETADGEKQCFQKIQFDLGYRENTYDAMINKMNDLIHITPDRINIVDSNISEIFNKAYETSITIGEHPQKWRIEKGLDIKKQLGPLVAQFSDSPQSIKTYFIDFGYFPTVICNGYMYLGNLNNQDIGLLALDSMIDQLWLTDDMLEYLTCPFFENRIICDKKNKNYCSIKSILKLENRCVVEEKLLPLFLHINPEFVKKITG